MRNRGLAGDHVHRAEARLRAIEVLFEAKSWADVVRESQEVVELALKGLLRAFGIDAPRIHDVSDVLIEQRARFPETLRKDIGRLAAISKQLRRDRELAFYGTEDLTPSEFYSREDAVGAMEGAQFTVERVRPHVPRAADPTGG
jgi:HEPN domain-containing protein